MPAPTNDMLPALTTPGAVYHAIYSTERLRAEYVGPLATISPGEGLAGSSDIGVGATGLTAASLPVPVARIYGMYDQSGGAGGDIIQTAPESRPHLLAAAAIGGRLAMTFWSHANVAGSCTLAGANVLQANSRTEIFVIDPSCSIQNAVWSEHADSGNTVKRDAYTQPSEGGLFNVVSGNKNVRIAASPQVLIVTESPFGCAVFVDGVKIVDATAGPAAIAKVMLGGSAYGVQYNANIRLGAYVAIEGAINDADALAITAAAQARFGLPTGYLVNLVHAGDSIVESIADTDTLGLKHHIVPNLGKSTRYWNLGISGKTMASCYADRAGYEGAMFAPGKINVALIDGGINDIGLNGTTGAALYNGIATPYIAALKAMGYKVGLVSLLPQTAGLYGGSIATIESERNAYNTLLRANSAGADFIVDRAGVASMGTYPTSPNDASRYRQESGGGLHPTTLGYSEIAPVYVAAINAAIGSDTVDPTPTDPTGTGVITAVPQQTITPQRAQAGSGSAADVLPLGAYVWEQALDPRDLAPRAFDFGALLADGETIAQVLAVRLIDPTGDSGVRIHSEDAYAPIIDADTGRKVQFYLRVQEDRQSSAPFEGQGLKVGVSIWIETDATPPSRYERTGIQQVRQL